MDNILVEIGHNKTNQKLKQFKKVFIILLIINLWHLI